MRNKWHIGLFSGLFLLAMVLSQRVGWSLPVQSVLAPTGSQRLMPSDFEGGERFGSAVALQGDTAVVGAYSQNNFRGSVYIYTRNGDTWSESKKLISSDGVAFDQFGTQVALDGDTLVVASPYADAYSYSWHGKVYIFERNAGGPNNWGQVKKLDDLYGEREAKWFGYAIAIQDDLLAVGAPNEEEDGTVVLFERNQGGANNWGQVKRITIDDHTRFRSDFGSAVAFYGDVLVVGNSGHTIDDQYFDQGSAYIFERNAGGPDNWGEVKMLFDPNGTPDDMFGITVTAGEDIVIVGAEFADVGSKVRQGAVYIYGRHEGGDNNWGLVKKLTAADGNDNDNFGDSIALSGDQLLVGADGDDIFYVDQGSAYLFGRDEGGTNNWGQVKKWGITDGWEDDYFGTAVALDGETALIGASGVDIPEIFKYGVGAVYVAGVANYAVYLPYVQR